VPVPFGAHRGNGVGHSHGGAGGPGTGLVPRDDLGHAGALGELCRLAEQVRLQGLAGEGGFAGEFVAHVLRDIADLARAGLGGIALAGFYLVLALISPSGLGMGDVKAAAGLGVMLAWPGWASLIEGSFAGFMLAAVYGAVLLISGHATRKTQFPFGPFMIAGAFLVVLVFVPVGSHF
jgi:leader peptidase (prepilin peptidase) / N-methyltransferase